MSLTSLLRGTQLESKQFQAIVKEVLPTKVDFQTYSGKEAFAKKAYVEQEEFAALQASDAALVGTAFDYLARVLIARVAKEGREQLAKHFVATYGYEALMASAVPFEQKMALSREWIEAKKRWLKFPKNKKSIDTLIDDAIFFARLEQIYRIGQLPKQGVPAVFIQPIEHVHRTLQQLCATFAEHFLPLVQPTSAVIYNPRFGVSASFVGGADGDVWIDGVLYDFKTTKDVGYKWQDVAQLVGYYALHDLSKQLVVATASENVPSITRLAMYRARFGEIEYVETSSLDATQWRSMQQALIDYFTEHQQQLAEMVNLQQLRHDYMPV